jgi:hypothetical protein
MNNERTKLRQKFIYSFTSAFVNGKKEVMWARYPYPTKYNWEMLPKVEWVYLAMRNTCAITEYEMSDFIYEYNTVKLKKKESTNFETDR